MTCDQILIAFLLIILTNTLNCCFCVASFGLGRPQELVANVYRCLVPILNNKDGSVITPLLNTGDQVN